MAAREKLPFGFAFLSMLHCFCWFWMHPYYDFMSAELHVYIGNLLFIFLHALIVVPMLLNRYDFPAYGLERLIAGGAVTLVAANAAKYWFRTACGAEAVWFSFLIDFVMIVGLSLICRRIVNGKNAPKAGISKQHFWLMAGALAGMIAIAFFVQTFVSRRSFDLYNKDAESCKYALQSMQLIVTAAGYAVVGLSTLFSLPILAGTRRNPEKKSVERGKVLVLLVILCMIEGCVIEGVLKGLVQPYGNIVKMAGASQVEYLRIDDAALSSEPFRIQTTCESVIRHAGISRDRRIGRITSDETLRIITVYDSAERIKGRVLATDPSEYFTLQLGETTVGVKHPYFLIYLDGDQQQVFSLDTLGKAEGNALLTAFARNRTEAGDLRLFEQCATYLCRYDADFIRPYLQRYARREFTDTEREALEDIREDYIYGVATELLQQAGDAPE